MANKGAELKATIKIGGEIDPSVKRSIKAAGAAVSKLGNSFVSIGKTAAVAGATIAAAMSAVAVKIGVDCIKASTAFEKQMSNVATLLDGNVNKRVAALGEELIKVSKASGVASEDLTDGLYQVISAFGDGADSVQILATAATAAKAGNATTTDSVNLLSAVMKGYGDVSAEAARRTADLAFQTVKLGQTSFPELAASMGKVIPLASTMGVTQEELFGAMATLTGVTGGTAEVTTQLRGAIQGFLQPTKDMMKAINALGYADGKAMLKANGLQHSLLALHKTVKGNDIAFAQLFGSVEAKNAVLALAGSQAENMAQKTKAMEEASGAASRAFDAQTDNLSDLIAKIKNYGANVMLEIGNKVQPILKSLAEKTLPQITHAFDLLRDKVFEVGRIIKKWVRENKTVIRGGLLRVFDELRGKISSAIVAVKKIIADIDFQKIKTDAMLAWNELQNIFAKIHEGIGWIEDNKDMLLSIGKAVAVFIGGAVAVVKLVNAFLSVKSAVASLIPALTFLATNPIGWVILGITAIIAAVAALYVYWDEVTGWMSEKWQQFAQKFPCVANELTYIWGAVKNYFVSLWEDICYSLTFAWDNVCLTIKAAWEIVSAAFSGNISFFFNIWEALCAAFAGDFGSAKEALLRAWDSLKSSIFTIIDAIKNYFSGMIDHFIHAFDHFIGKVTGSKNILGKITDSVANSKINPKNWFAAGGFTNGPSICGEAGTEAVISFDPAYRRENQGYLMTAAEMLGMTATPSERGHAVNYNLGGVTFAPVIKTERIASNTSLMQQLRSCMPDFLDAIERALKERRSHAY